MGPAASGYGAWGAGRDAPVTDARSMARSDICNSACVHGWCTSARACRTTGSGLRRTLHIACAAHIPYPDRDYFLIILQPGLQHMQRCVPRPAPAGAARARFDSSCNERRRLAARAPSCLLVRFIGRQRCRRPRELLPVSSRVFAPPRSVACTKRADVAPDSCLHMRQPSKR